jgi:hypothetical protein
MQMYAYPPHRLMSYKMAAGVTKAWNNHQNASSARANHGMMVEILFWWSNSAWHPQTVNAIPTSVLLA